MQALCHEYDALFVLDEVQTGVGLTGTPWAYQQLGLEPDIVAFAKKVQVGGIMAGRRVDEVPDNVFAVSEPDQLHLGRRPGRHGPLPADPRDHRGGRAVRPRRQGRRRASCAACTTSATATRTLVSNVRGRGLMCALDLPDTATRDQVVSGLRDERVLVLPAASRSVRFRPAAVGDRR